MFLRNYPWLISLLGVGGSRFLINRQPGGVVRAQRLLDNGLPLTVIGYGTSP